MADLPNIWFDIWVMRKILSLEYQPHVCGKIFRMPWSRPNLPISGWALSQNTDGQKQATKRLKYTTLKTFFYFIKNMEGQALLNPCDTAMLRKTFRSARGQQWTILGKDTVDEIIFKPTNPETGSCWNWWHEAACGSVRLYRSQSGCQKSWPKDWNQDSPPWFTASCGHLCQSLRRTTGNRVKDHPPAPLKG